MDDRNVPVQPADHLFNTHRAKTNFSQRGKARHPYDFKWGFYIISLTKIGEKMTNMAFSKSIIPMREFRKTVTRRYGQHNAKPAQIIQAVEKAQGIPKGEHVVPICEIQLLTPRWERADRMITDQAYGEREVILEGFPEMKPSEFVEMLCDMNKKRADELVHRLEFRFLLRSRYFPFENTQWSLEDDWFEYQPDGTLAGKYVIYGKANRHLLDTYRFDL